MLIKYFKHLFRRGRTFKKCLSEIVAIEKYSASELRDYQNEKLKAIVKIAYENVPYYHDSFKRLKLSYTDFKTIDDLPKLPLINKKIIQENLSNFRNKNFKGFVIKGFTSGTTGSPGVFLRDMRSINYEEAFIVRQWQWAGLNTSMKKSYLRGDHLFKNEKSAPPYWKFNAIENKLMLSSYHLSDKTLPAYIAKIKHFGPKLLQAYPSTAFTLAKYLEKTNDHLNIPVIQTSSETLYPPWRELIEERLNAKMFDYYGQAERVVFAAECEHHQGLHIAPTYSLFELIDAQGNSGMTQGRIVGTTLNNFVMPLLRYQTDDLAEMLEQSCPCGRSFPSIKPLEAREWNTIMTSSGRVISHCLFAVFFRKLQSIKMSQLIQKKDFSFVVMIVKEENYTDSVSLDIMRNIQELMGEDVSVEIVFVEDIPRTKNGKYRWIISERNQ
jgi:phenylacetate-CoA ligase